MEKWHNSGKKNHSGISNSSIV